MKPKDMIQAAWVRLQLLHNPDLTVEDLEKAHDRDGREGKLPATKQQLIYAERSKMVKRWGIKNLSDLPPLKSDKTLNITRLLKLYFNQNGTEGDLDAAVKFFATNGIELVKHNFEYGRRMYRERTQADPKQDAGPRAGKPVKEPKPEKEKLELPAEMFLSMLKDTANFVRKVGGIGPARKILEILEMSQIDK